MPDSTAPVPVAALPMYLGNPDAVEQVWAVLAGHLRAAGLAEVPVHPVWPIDFHAHWLESRLLLSQACGYPLVTTLRQDVRVVGAFCYDVPGCQGIFQRSQIIVRSGDPAGGLEDLRGRCVAFNGTDSQSGYNSLRASIAPLARDGRFFGTRIRTGSHLESVRAVGDGRADVASIDCVSLAGFRRHAPLIVEGTRVLAETAPYPGLPLITAARTPDATLAALRSALRALLRDRAAEEALRDLFITGFEPMNFADYQPCQAMHDAAFALHYTEL